jgi:hypothetical protein
LCDSSVVDYYINTAASIHRVLSQCFNFVSIGDITGKATRFNTQLLKLGHRSLNSISRQIGDDNFCAIEAKLFRQRKTDTTGAASDHDNLVLKVFHSSCPLLENIA